MRGLAFLLLAAAAAAPTPQRPAFDAFEVASIKPAPANTIGRWIRMQAAQQFAVHNQTVRGLLAAAYHLSPQEILGGPAMVDADRWEIVAKTPGNARPTLDEQMAMLRQLLADRFQIKFHREPKEMSIYALRVAKGGAKLRPTEITADTHPEGPPPLIFVVTLPVLKLPARYATMADFASVLQRAALERPVVDQTGIEGRYDFDLEFTPDETLFGGAFGKSAEDSGKPGLLAAITEQLGLKLEGTRGAVSVLVIDHVAKPSDN